MKQKYKVSIVIGRLQGMHNAHKKLFLDAKEYGDQTLFLLGSSNAPIGMKNPWSYEVRRELLTKVMEQESSIHRRIKLGSTFFVRPLPDFPNNDELWFSHVRKEVNDLFPGVADEDICIVGHEKDQSSWYLKAFQEWNFIPIPSYGNISATDIREDYFRDAPRIPYGIVPEPVAQFMSDWWTTEEFQYVLGEVKWKQKYNKEWGNGPFITVDNVVTWAGKVLLVLRSDYPAKGCWALPGGFLDPSKGNSFDNAVAELFEETTLSDQHGRIPKGKLKSFYKDRVGKRFDEPGRSIRGFTLTTAFRVILPPSKKFYIKGDDDAVDAKWFNISDLAEMDLMEDHYSIIQEMVN